MYENSSLRLAAYRALSFLGCPHRSGEGNSHPLSFEASDSSCFIVVCYMLQYSTHSLVVFFSTCIEAVCIHGLFKQLPWYLYLMLLFTLYMPTEVNYRYVFYTVLLNIILSLHFLQEKWSVELTFNTWCTFGRRPRRTRISIQKDMPNTRKS